MSQELSLLKQQQYLSESLNEGKAEAAKVKAFMDGLGDIKDKSDLFHLLKKKEILTELSKGKSNLYFTPSDVNLSIQTKADKS